MILEASPMDAALNAPRNAEDGGEPDARARSSETGEKGLNPSGDAARMSRLLRVGHPGDSEPPEEHRRMQLARPSAQAIARWSLALLLALAALFASGVTFFIVTNDPDRTSQSQIATLIAANVVVAGALTGVIAVQLWRLWGDRRHGLAGAKLHVRLIGLFTLAAALPATVLAAFAIIILEFGLEQWLGERINRGVQNGRTLAQAYLGEHAQSMQLDLELMAYDLARVGTTLNLRPDRSPIQFRQYLAGQAVARGLAGVMLIDKAGTLIARIELAAGRAYPLPPASSFAEADSGAPLVYGVDDPGTLYMARGLYKLEQYDGGYLLGFRVFDPGVREQLLKTREFAQEFAAAQTRREQLEAGFIIGYAALALVVLSGAMFVGLWAATSIVSPVGALITASQRVRNGDLAARVDVQDGDSELNILARAFNRMTAQLQTQRDDLVEANRQFDQRRRFTETVLAGVSAGVIGLTKDGAISIANRSALTLLDVADTAILGRPLNDVAPELTPLVREAMGRHTPVAEGQIDIVREGRVSNLNVRVAGDDSGSGARSLVITFDDITSLVSAQRTAAWGDVARRIAHEIKNPLTPIQLSAERLRRKYAGEISSNPDVFHKCTDTIIRQVSDIGRMVDEFSSFARMPTPAITDEDVGELISSAVFPQRVSWPDIEFNVEKPASAVFAPCDGRLVVQALTNILKNAGEAVSARLAEEGAGEAAPGRIDITLKASSDDAIIDVADNGVGLPQAERHRLTEPYMTTRTKGTGLGLAIVKKIMEEHGGALTLTDCSALGGRGARVRLSLPLRSAAARPSAADAPEANVADTAAAELESLN
ncbi:MAG: PAS domain-containing sensor histidine kinase [Pseudomonadota bacterium]